MGTVFRTIHYKCCFTIIPENSYFDWASLIKIVRSWISRNRNARFDRTQLSKAWFFKDGELRGDDAFKSFLKVVTEIGDGERGKPEFWALRFEHQDTKFKHRRWYTDIGITTIEKGFSFSLVLSHELASGYYGLEPELPLSTSPALIHELLTNESIAVYSGDLRLSSGPILLDKKNVHTFWEIIKNSSRRLPIVLLMPNNLNGEIKLDYTSLAKQTAGTAIIYYGAINVSHSLREILPDEYMCYAGYVRIYQPCLNFVSPTDPRRHRYFSKTDIELRSADKIEEIIARSIARHELYMFTSSLTYLEDVYTKARERRLQQLKQEGKSNEEWLALYEEENIKLNDKIKQLEFSLSGKEQKLYNLEDENDAAQFKIQSLSQQNQNLNIALAQLQKKADLCQIISDLPSSLLDIIAIFEVWFSDKIAFTSKAKESARISKFKDVGIAWRCIYDISTLLYSLYFDSAFQKKDIEKEWESRTKFGFARGESKTTKRDNSLMALRKDYYKGEEIDISPHISYGKGEQQCLRIHFFVHQQEKIIIIGHCGDHLETSGTRRK